eukprot:scaffold202284_cov19-Tisochrysis_lutea.AAC.1
MACEGAPHPHASTFACMHVALVPALPMHDFFLGCRTPLIYSVFRCFTSFSCYPISLRARSNDAGLAAAEIALEVERSVLDMKSEDTVGTTGILEIKPGAINSVPREAKLGIGAQGARWSLLYDGRCARVRGYCNCLRALQSAVLLHGGGVCSEVPWLALQPRVQIASLALPPWNHKCKVPCLIKLAALQPLMLSTSSNICILLVDETNAFCLNFTTDIRDVSEERRDAVVKRVLKAAEE